MRPSNVAIRGAGGIALRQNAMDSGSAKQHNDRQQHRQHAADIEQRCQP